MINSLKKFAEHWAKCMMSMQNELALIMQYLHQKSINLHISSENQKDLTWQLAYK